MSDEFDFGFEDTTQTATETATTQEQPAQQPTGPSLEDFQAVQRELDNAKRFQQDFTRFAQSVTGQQQQAQPQDRLQKFIQDPDGYENELLGRAAQMARAELQEANAVAKVEAEFPELAPFKDVIDWEKLMQITAPQFRQKHGRIPSLEEALRESASYVKTNLQGQAGGQAQAAQRDVLRLNAGGSPPPSNGEIDPFQMSDADWGAFRRANGY